MSFVISSKPFDSTRDYLHQFGQSHTSKRTPNTSITTWHLQSPLPRSRPRTNLTGLLCPSRLPKPARVQQKGDTLRKKKPGKFVKRTIWRTKDANPFALMVVAMSA